MFTKTSSRKRLWQATLWMIIGLMDIWVYDRMDDSLQPVTSGVEALYPLWLGSAEASPEPVTPSTP